MLPSSCPSPATTPSGYARRLLHSLGLDRALPLEDQRSAASLWASSGLQWLSGHPEAEPRACPAPLAACAQGCWLGLSALVPELDPTFNASALLGERAAIAGYRRRGRTSPGGACQLLATADGMLALNLAREDDRELLPAWLQQELSPDADQQLHRLLRQHSTAELVERGRLLGLAVAPLVKQPAPPAPAPGWFRSERLSPAVQPQGQRPLVIDLTALWAGPLCGQILADCGARVIKVESLSRPDGARRGPAAFYHLMNADKQSVALDLGSESGRSQLLGLLRRADIVLESARPRGLEQMGIRAAELVAERPGLSWLSITGYGRRAPMRDWIAYGDDAGVGAGLSWLMGSTCQPPDPVFCGDAIADPLTGLHAALLAWASWQSGGGQLLDVSLQQVVVHCIAAGSAVETGDAGPVLVPQARQPRHQAAALGADTERVLEELL